MASDGPVQMVMGPGHHLLVRLAPLHRSVAKTYCRVFATSLEVLPFRDGNDRSVYNKRALLRGGRRPESTVLWLVYPDFFQAGWSRQVGTRRWGFEADKAGLHNPDFYREANSIPFQLIPGFRRF